MPSESAHRREGSAAAICSGTAPRPAAGRHAAPVEKTEKTASNLGDESGVGCDWARPWLRVCMGCLGSGLGGGHARRLRGERREEDALQERAEEGVDDRLGQPQAEQVVLRALLVLGEGLREALRVP